MLTANGAVPISEIEAGQQVLAAPDDGLAESYASNDVGTKIVIGEASLVQLHVLHEDGSQETINTTDEHPFHAADTGEWTRADQLRVGDHLSTISGTAELLGVVYTTERVPVYNLSIPGSPTYYVGEHGVWVHNCDLPVPSFNAGMSEALGWLSQRGFGTLTANTVARLGPHKGKPIGRMTADGKAGYRIETDGRSGFHINVWGPRTQGGKGPHIIIKNGSEAGMNAILRQLFPDHY